MRFSSRSWRTVQRTALVAVMMAAGWGFADDLDRELQFASGLVEMGFPDFSERLLDRMIQANPAVADRAKAIQVEILLSRRRFDEAEQLTASLPENKPSTDAARLAIANGYFRIGNVEKARALYQLYFDKNKDHIPEDPDVRRFYTDSAYRYGQMLEQSGDLKGASDAFELMLRTEPPDALKRRLQYELAALCVRAAKKEEGAARTVLLDKASKLCDEIQWKGIDLWFGKSVITLAHIQIVKGAPDAAAGTIRSYLDILDQVEKMLKDQGMDLSLSPLAGARFLLGEIYAGQAVLLETSDSEKAIKLYTDALGHFYNVFAKYSESEWGPDAGIQAECIQTKLKSLGRTVHIDLGAFADKVSAAQLRLADEQYARREYAAAAKAYAPILSRFPNTPNSPRALSNLLMCHVQLNDTLEMKAVAEHISERYSHVPDAGMALLLAGKYYFDANQKENYVYLYDRFVTCFPKHPKTPAILFSLAGLLQRAGDVAGNRKYLEILIRDYKGDAFYFRALGIQAWNLYGEQKFDQAAEAFRAVIEPSPPSHERAIAQATLADCFVRLDRFQEAVKEFQTLQQWLASEKDNPYGSTTAEIKKNREMLEKASFFSSYSLSRIAVTAEELPRVREAAIQQLRAFLQKYPKADTAPRAMSLIGTMQVELGQTEASSATFNELAQLYPASEEGRNARFSLIRSAIDIKKPDIAREAFRKMMDESSKYSMDQILRVSQWMLDAGLYAEAAAGFEKIQASHPEDRAVSERSLYGWGKAAYELGQYDVAAGKMGELLAAFPLTGLFFDAQFTLGRAHREAGRLEEAVEALRNVFQRADTPVRANTANIELARVQKKLAERATAAGKPDEASTFLHAAVASYQRVALFGDPANREIQPMVVESLMESIRIFSELKRYTDALNTCDQYLRDFPAGEQVAAVRRLRADANFKAAMTAAPPPDSEPKK